MRNEKYTFLKLKIKLKGQTQCLNARIKVFDSSLTMINMPTNEHLVYKKKMASSLMFNGI
jgi:hypothetical protein